MLIGVIAEETLLPLIIAPPIWFDGGPLAQVVKRPDIFYQARSTIIGFVMPGLVDETGFGAENFFHTYITQDYNGIFPELYDDTVPEIFYSPTRTAVPVLVSAYFVETDLFYLPIIPVNPPLHPLGRYTDTDIFYTPALFQGFFPQRVIDDDIIRAQVVRRDGDAFVLLTEVFSDTDVLFTPSLARAVLPGLVIDSDIIYASKRILLVAPGVFSSDDTFFAAFIFNQVQPTRILDVDVFIGPELRTPGRMGLVVDDDIFFVPSVQFAPLAPSFMNDADVFLSSVIASNPALYPLDPVIDVDDTFYVSNVILFQALAPHLWPDVDTSLGTLSIILGQGLAPSAITDADAVLAPTLPLVLSPLLFDASDVFYTPTILNFTQPLAPSWILETDTFLVPSVAALAGFDGTLSLDGPIMPSTLQPTVIYVEG